MKKYFKGVDGLEPGTYYNYSAMTTNVIMNYVIYKTGDDWNKLLHKIFVEDALELLKEFIFIKLYMLIKLVTENLVNTEDILSMLTDMIM